MKQTANGRSITYKPKNLPASEFSKRAGLMMVYARSCGYDYPPFTWHANDYSSAGWRALIRDNKQKW